MTALSRQTALLQAHGGYLLMALVAVFAKIIPWDAVTIVSGRMLIGGLALALILVIQRKSLHLQRTKDLPRTVATALLLTLHWVTFFMAIKIASIPLAVVSVSSTPIFSSLLETPLEGRPLRPRSILLSLLVVIGIVIMTDNLSLSSASFHGALLGTFSAFCKALRDILSRPLAQESGSMLVMVYQLLIGGAVTIPFVSIPRELLTLSTISNLLILAIIGTAAAHTLVMASTKTLTANTTHLLGPLASLYQVILGILIVSEYPSPSVIIGGTIIITVSIYETKSQALTPNS